MSQILLIKLEVYLLAYIFLLSFYCTSYAMVLHQHVSKHDGKIRGFYGIVNNLANEV